jgi:hypothetical protein
LIPSYQKKFKLAGIIYLHRITDPRISANALKNIRTLERICGRNAMQNIALVTTMWNEIDKDVAKTREDYLFGQFWSEMLNSGARAHRFKDSFPSAWEITDSLLQLPPAPDLLLQTERVRQKKAVHETQAGMPPDTTVPSKWHRRLQNQLALIVPNMLRSR